MAYELALLDSQGKALESVQPNTVKKSTEGSFRILNGTPRLNFGRSDLKGAEPKQFDHRLYLAMYYQHPMLFSAINTIVRTATNTGWEFVPRSKLAKQNENELAVAIEFFSKQNNFMYELTRIYEDLLIFGDAFFYIVPDRRRKPARLKRLPPWTVHVKADSNGKVKGYVQKDLNNPKEDAVVFGPQEILHFKWNDPGNDLYGLSPLEPLKASITVDLHMLNFQKMFFKNGAQLGTYITIDGATDAELERAEEWFADNFVGTENAFRPLVMGGAGIKVTPAAHSHQDMNFIQGRDYVVSEIIAVLGVPPAKLGRMETANRSNAKEQDKSFRTETVAPYQNTVERVINDEFLRPILHLEDTIFEHSKSDIRDAIEQMDLNTAAVGWGLNTINEIRERMGYPKIDGGDVAFVMTPTGAVPVDRLDLYFQLPSPNSEDVPEVSRSPAKGEPTPKSKKPKSEGDGAPPANKYMKLVQNANAVRMWLTKDDDASLGHALAYSYDANEVADHPVFEQVIESIEKALDTPNKHARLAYINRAQEFVNTLLPEGNYE